MVRFINVGGLLFAIWLLLSGHYTPLVTGFGVVSCGLVVFIAGRMRVLDEEGHPLPWGLVTYAPWLAWEVWKANVAVLKVVLHPRLPIQPQVVYFEGSQETDFGRVVYANSITLTPGTITTGVAGRHFQVHALTRAAVDGTEEGEMDRRVTRMERSP